jgi:hypothetical protein
MRVPAAEAVPLGRRMSWQKIDNAFGGEVVSFARGLLSASGVVRGSARHKEREDHPLPWRGTVGVLLCEFSRSRAMLAGEPFFLPGHTSRVKIFERYAGKTLLRMLDSRTAKARSLCDSCLPTKNLPHFKNAYTTFPQPLFARVDLQKTPCQLPCRRLTTGRLLGGDNCAKLQKLPAVCIAETTKLNPLTKQRN